MGTTHLELPVALVVLFEPLGKHAFFLQLGAVGSLLLFQLGLEVLGFGNLAFFQSALVRSKTGVGRRQHILDVGCQSCATRIRHGTTEIERKAVSNPRVISLSSMPNGVKP